MHEQVLIVEDENDVAELLRYNLEKEKYRVSVACSGAVAVDAFRHHMPDIVLLDIMLPVLDGWEVCRLLRESPKGKSVPIVMLTALSSEEARIRGLSLGADDYVSKPFSVREIMLKVRRLIDRQHTITTLSTKAQEQDTSLRYLVHELKNSMNVIGGFSSLALRKEDVHDYLRTIKVAAVHADGLLNNASLLSHLEKQQGSLPLGNLDISTIVGESAAILRDTAKNRQIEINIENNLSRPVIGNGTAVRQVLMNLVSNAVKYNRQGGKIWINVEEMHDRVDISITDEGFGIEQDEIPRIFDKFYRTAAGEQNKGAGLGLYIVKLLIEAMGGTISVVSRPGVGSTFTASFQKSSPVPDSPDDRERKLPMLIPQGKHQ